MTRVTTNWALDHPWASIYDFFVEREPLSRPLGRVLFGTDARLLYDALDAIGDVRAGASILDIPCGGGVALRGLSPAQDVRYVAADISEAMLERTRRMAQRLGHGAGQRATLELQIADVEALPFADGEFQLCLSFAGLHCFPRPALAVAEIGRCLAPHGRFVGSMFVTDGGLRYLPLIVSGRVAGLMGPSGSTGELRDWLAGAGLDDVRVTRSGAIAYFEAQRRAV